MDNRWDATRATEFVGPLGELVYGSRLLGAEPALVLHGGGNTSIKATVTDITGDTVEVLHVKGSGHDLATIDEAGFATLRLERVRRLGELEHMSDTQMVNELRAALVDTSAPNPSVEAILHASLPHRAVLHSHADALLALTGTEDDERHLRACYGDALVSIPYVMPGFPLARDCARLFPEQAHDATLGMVLRKHGLFTFGATVEEAYNRMIQLVTMAEEYVRSAGTAARTPTPVPLRRDPAALAKLRRDVSDAAGAPMICQVHRGADVAAFLGRSDLDEVSQQGPITPDHVLRTKRVPLVGRDVAGYVHEYKAYVKAYRDRSIDAIEPLDPAPRVVLDAELGLITVGRRPADAAIVNDLYNHTMGVIEHAELLGGYRSLPAHDVFDVEYWDLEQAKLRSRGAPKPLAGQIALVTGAASGIGKACADALQDIGAAVVGLDLDPEVEQCAAPDRVGITVDLCEHDATIEAVEHAVDCFGGIDIVVASAGVFGASKPIVALTGDEWRHVQDTNTDATRRLFAATHPFLVQSPVYGRVVVIGSKNVDAPGMGAAAYSASKAALTQLARVAALEWAGDGIRVNVVHPDAVFDTGLWTEERLEQRATEYGMTVDEYRRRNLLNADVRSADVGSLVAAMCGPAFRVTTGAQVPVDGGSDRVI